MNKIIVLGGGMVGSAMAIDLAKKHHVLLTDVDPSALEKAKKNNLVHANKVSRKKSRCSALLAGLGS